MEVFLAGVQLKKRGLVAALVPIFPLFAWHYVFSYLILRFIMGESTETLLTCYASFNLLISFGAISGSFLIHKMKKESVVSVWAVLSSAGTILITLAPTVMSSLAIYLLLGFLFGIALLAFFTFFWDMTASKERGRVSGLVGFISLPIFPLVYSLAKNLDLFATSTLCIIFNLTTLGIVPLGSKKITTLRGKKASRGYTPEKRTILFYLIPWVIFSVINATLGRVISFHVSQSLSPSSVTLLVSMQAIGGGLGAIIGGLVADFFGRRISLASGLTLYGISSAISGLAGSYELFCLSHLGIGITWGIFSTLYLFVIWGDLATVETCPRRYSVGLAIYYSATAVGSLLGSGLYQIPLLVASMVSCLLIFLSNIPILLAPELLPSDFREEIGHKLYISLVKKKLKRLSNHG
jgi:MFS family permease